MSGGEVTAENQVRVAYEAKMTPARLQDALNEVHAAGVPEWADLTLGHSPSWERWTLKAAWAPRPPFEEGKAPMHPSWEQHMAAASQLARKAPDNPQA